MKEIVINYSTSSTKVYIANDLMKLLATFLYKSKKYFVITDDIVHSLYSHLFKDLNVDFYVIKNGEKSKKMEVVNQIISYMFDKHYTKTDVIINFGGGVVSDLGSFVASIYKRGIEYINIPTTLIAQIDAAVGGKTGINYFHNNSIYKNQLGTIYHPNLVLVDPVLLKSLKEEDYQSGLGEVIKYGLCFSPELFSKIDINMDLEDIIYSSLLIKAKIVEEDEFDNNVRLALNYGHTIAHAIEGINKGRISHGIAVLYGLIIETKSNEIKNELVKLARKLGIKLNFNFNFEKLKQLILEDKKIRNNKLKLPILKEIGRVEIEEVEIDDFIEGLK